MDWSELKDFLDEKTLQYQGPEFLETDPIQVPHAFLRKEDREVSGFLTATIAWGNRQSIIRSARSMMALMDDSPYDFTMEATARDLQKLSPFVHRTFNGQDLVFFIIGLRHLYRAYGGMEPLFQRYAEAEGIQGAISRVRAHFFEPGHLQRTEKHFSDPLRGSAAKRINMFLRWMVRPAKSGVDFGIWPGISPSWLSCPLDVHSGKVARALGLLQRRQDDAKAVKELDTALRKLDPEDPVKYDFALFGLGVFEQFG
ncbi:TIGR02757 family protein [Robiginitalea marina]|uniref:TIGR02757 family protein n=1 Tax=Robiginitalea marina TaxID=2954105 RepID=A0ABT1AVG3_9FLAO|nr:TIGR02757 family protein [Robiginitalea marina]MCO5723615.1 TIGR02757 family protein [Robiginitalea marina]